MPRPGWTWQVTAAPGAPVPDVSVNVTAAVLVATRLPSESTMATTGWALSGSAAVPLPGCVSNCRAAAGPALMSKGALVPKTPSSTSMA